jgi:hypothetical protein
MTGMCVKLDLLAIDAHAPRDFGCVTSCLDVMAGGSGFSDRRRQLQGRPTPHGRRQLVQTEQPPLDIEHR